MKQGPSKETVELSRIKRDHPIVYRATTMVLGIVFAMIAAAIVIGLTNGIEAML